MYELLYISVSPKGFSEPELKDLLRHARLKNRNNNVTGMLIYCGREFMQILEGEEQIVKDLFQTISTDSRHCGIDVFYQGPIKSRAFTDWSMAFKSIDRIDFGERATFYENHNPAKTPMNMIKDSPNRGKEAFLTLRDTL